MKIKKTYLFSLFFILIFTLSLFYNFSSEALAQDDGTGVRISPTRVEDLVDPGGLYRYEISVTNKSNIFTTLYAYLKDFKAGGEGGQPVLVAPGSEEGYFLAAWIDITSEGIEFAPNEEKVIPFNIKVPEETGPGGYYGGIYFGTKAPRISTDSEEQGAGMSVAQQTGCLVLLQIKGDALEEARIREFNTNKDVYNTPFDVNFIVRIENKGNIHVKPIGNISINNMFGKEVAVVRVNERGGNVLPDSIRRFEERWSGENGFGRYQAIIGLSYGTSVDLGGQGKQSLYTEKYFWIIPWKIIMPLTLGFIFFLAVFILMMKLYRNKAVKKAMQQAGLGHVKYVKKYQGPSPTAHLAMILLVVLGAIFLMMVVMYFLFFA